MSRPACYYCDGTGTLDRQTDVDAFEDVPCSYCEGTGEAMHSANTCTRWIGPKYWITGGMAIGDPLVITARARAAALKHRGGWRAPLQWVRYGEIRQIAVSPLDHPLPGAPAPATEWSKAA